MKGEQAWVHWLQPAAWQFDWLAWVTCMSLVVGASDGCGVLLLDAPLRGQATRPACSDRGEGPGQAPG